MEKVTKNVFGNQIIILRRKNKWYAFESLCPHASQPLLNGRVRDNILECIWHNISFNLETGEIVFDSGFRDIPNLKVYKIKVENNEVYVKVTQSKYSIV